MVTLPFNGLMIASFVAASSLALIVFLLLGTRKDRVDRRIGGLAGAGNANPGQAGAFSRPTSGGPQARLVTEPRLDQWTSRRIKRAESKQGFRDRMVQAGFYSRRGAALLLTLRIILLIVPAAAGVAASRMGYITLAQGLLFGALAGLAGTVAPVLWLSHVKRLRQTKIRRALPDALDVMVICLEGGISLAAALSRVARELATAHPLLAVELNIVERQVQMGLTTGEAVRGLADRFDLEELRSMSSVIVQAERVGASVADALRVFADTLRQKRHQRAEEMAHKASVKLLFPTIFFIFPGIFVVLLGPAAIRIYYEIINGVLQLRP